MNQFVGPGAQTYVAVSTTCSEKANCAPHHRGLVGALFVALAAGTTTSLIGPGAYGLYDP